MRDVVAAFRAKITGVTVYEAGKVPNSPGLPYVVVSGSPPRVGSVTASDRSTSKHWRLVTLYVGNSESSALWAAEKVEDSLLDVRLTVAGLNCSRMKREAGRPIAPDPDVESLSSGADTWTFVTTPSA